MTPLRALLAGLLLVTALVVQGAALARIALPGASPDIVLLVVVALALQWGAQAGAVVGAAAGVLEDLAPPADGPLGRWMLVLTVVGYVVGSVSEDSERSIFVPLAAVAGAAAGVGLAIAAIGAIVGEPGTTWPRVLAVVPSAVIYDVVLSPFVVPAVLAMARRTGPEPGQHGHR